MNKNKTPKNACYFCEKCNFKTDNKTDYKRHLTTPKHQNNTILIINDNEKTQKNVKLICLCGNEYKYKSGLCAHKKKCIKKEEPENNNVSPELILNIIQQNQ